MGYLKIELEDYLGTWYIQVRGTGNHEIAQEDESFGFGPRKSNIL